MRRLLKTLRRDSGGIAAVEFAVILPAFLILLMGGFDLGHTLYMRTVVQGAVQKAARDSTLESASPQTIPVIDQKVREQIESLNTSADIAITRRFYRTFSQAAAAQHEPITGDGDNLCEPGETYTDSNGNLVWDSDGGDEGQGGARDITIYTVRVSYPRMFPVARLIGLSENVTVEGKTVLQNQPFGRQGTYTTPVLRQCPAA